MSDHLMYDCPMCKHSLHLFCGLKSRRQAEIRCLTCGHYHRAGRLKVLALVEKQKGCAQ